MQEQLMCGLNDIGCMVVWSPVLLKINAYVCVCRYSDGKEGDRDLRV